MTYCVEVRHGNKQEEALTDNYLMAWEIYRMMCEIYPSNAEILICDNSNGEIFQSNNKDFI